MYEFTMSRSSLTRLLLGILFLLPTLCTALPDDHSQPIHIKSDTAELDDAKGISIYQGNVIVDQGTLNLEGDTVTIYSNAKGISKLVTTGKPAHYQQKHEENKPLTHAFGNTIEYFLTEKRITIAHGARLVQGQNSFAGDRIDYDIKREVVNAYSDNSAHPDNPSRVEMVIQPNKVQVNSEPDNNNLPDPETNNNNE